MANRMTCSLPHTPCLQGFISLVTTLATYNTAPACGTPWWAWIVKPTPTPACHHTHPPAFNVESQECDSMSRRHCQLVLSVSDNVARTWNHISVFFMLELYLHMLLYMAPTTPLSQGNAKCRGARTIFIVMKSVILLFSRDAYAVVAYYSATWEGKK